MLASSLGALLSALAAAILGCGGDDPCDSVAGPAVVASIEVTPEDPSVLLGRTVQLTAVPHSACGNAVAGAAVAWASSSPEVASVTSDGLVTGESPGSAAITASSEGVSASVTVSVTCRYVWCGEDRRIAASPSAFTGARASPADFAADSGDLDVGR